MCPGAFLTNPGHLSNPVQVILPPPLRGSRIFPGTPARTDSASLGCWALRLFRSITTNPPMASAPWTFLPERGLPDQRRADWDLIVATACWHVPPPTSSLGWSQTSYRTESLFPPFLILGHGPLSFATLAGRSASPSLSAGLHC